MSKNYYLERKKANLCVQCRKPKEADRQNKVLCRTCSEKRSKETKEDREKYIALGVCPVCKQTDLFGDEKSCPECRARLLYERNDERYQKNKTYKKMRYESRKKAGLCTKCGKVLTEEDRGNFCCRECLDKDSKWRKKRASKTFSIREQWLYNGKCFFCGEDADEGYKTCKKCRDNHARLANKKLKENGAERGSYWRKTNSFKYSF